MIINNVEWIGYLFGGCFERTKENHEYYVVLTTPLFKHTKIHTDDSSLYHLLSIKTVVHLQKSRKKTTTTTEKKETRRGLQRRLRGARTTRLAASSSVAFVVSQAAAAVARRRSVTSAREWGTGRRTVRRGSTRAESWHLCNNENSICSFETDRLSV